MNRMPPSPSRRRALQWCLGLPTLLNLSPAAASAWNTDIATLSTAVPAPRPLLVLHDPRDRLALDVARGAQRSGIATLAVSGDVTTIWQEHLRAFWRNPDAMLIGVTRADALFCLDHLARDARHRLRYHAPVESRIPEALWSPDTRHRPPVHSPLSGEDTRQHAWLITTSSKGI